MDEHYFFLFNPFPLVFDAASAGEATKEVIVYMEMSMDLLTIKKMMMLMMNNKKKGDIEPVHHASSFASG